MLNWNIRQTRTFDKLKHSTNSNIRQTRTIDKLEQSIVALSSGTSSNVNIVSQVKLMIKRIDLFIMNLYLTNSSCDTNIVKFNFTLPFRISFVIFFYAGNQKSINIRTKHIHTVKLFFKFFSSLFHFIRYLSFILFLIFGLLVIPYFYFILCLFFFFTFLINFNKPFHLFTSIIIFISYKMKHVVSMTSVGEHVIHLICI